MDHLSALNFLIFLSIIITDFIYAKPQLPEEVDSSYLSSDTLGDWNLDLNNPVKLDLTDFALPNSVESASVLEPPNTLDSSETLFPQDDLLGTEIAAADCSSEGIESRSTFRRRQECTKPPQPPPQSASPQRTVEPKDKAYPDNLGLFEPYDPSVYGDKDQDACPPATYGNKVYSVCDSGKERDVSPVTLTDYASLQFCKPCT
jgi:hypothetical protein